MSATCLCSMTAILRPKAVATIACRPAASPQSPRQPRNRRKKWPRERTPPTAQKSALRSIRSAWRRQAASGGWPDDTSGHRRHQLLHFEEEVVGLLLDGHLAPVNWTPMLSERPHPNAGDHDVEQRAEPRQELVTHAVAGAIRVQIVLGRLDVLPELRQEAVWIFPELIEQWADRIVGAPDIPTRLEQACLGCIGLHVAGTQVTPLAIAGTGLGRAKPNHHHEQMP